MWHNVTVANVTVVNVTVANVTVANLTVANVTIANVFNIFFCKSCLFSICQILTLAEEICKKRPKTIQKRGSLFQSIFFRIKISQSLIKSTFNKTQF